MILAYCWGKSERRSRSTIPPSQIPFVWGEPIGSRSWSDLVFSSLFFLSYSPISISCFVGIWEWRIWALVFLPIAFGALVWVLGKDSVGWKVRSLLLLGSWNPRRFGDCCRLWTCWEPPIKLWRLPQALCKGFGCHLRRSPLSGAWGHLHRCAHGRIGWAGSALWVSVCYPNTSPKAYVLPLTRKELRENIPRVSVRYFYTRAFYLCTLLCDSLRAWSNISCYHIVAYLVSISCWCT